MKFQNSVSIFIASLALSPGFGAQEMPKPHAGGHVHKLGAPSTTLTVTIDGKAKLFSLADLQGMPQQDVTVFDKMAKRDMGLERAFPYYNSCRVRAAVRA